MTSDPEAFSRELVATVEAAAFFGAKVVNHYSDKIQPGTVPEIDRLHRYFDAALKRAKELGVTLALENEAGDASRTPENMLAIMQAFGSPNFKTNFDATNYYHASCEAFRMHMSFSRTILHMYTSRMAAYIARASSVRIRSGSAVR